MSEKLKEKNELLSDDELDKATGGAKAGSKYGTPDCPGPDRSSILLCMACDESGPHYNRGGKLSCCYHG